MTAQLQRLVVGAAWVILAMLAIPLLYDLAGTLWQGVQTEQPWPRLLFTIGVRSVPVVFFLFALALAVEVLGEASGNGVIHHPVQQVLWWTPRVSAMGLVALLALLSFDTFSGGYQGASTLSAFLLHLLPALILVLLLRLAWHHSWVGAVTFMAWGVWGLVTTVGVPVSVYVVTAGVPIAIGVLFLLNTALRGMERGQTGKGI